MKRIRPSEFQQRKIKKSKELALESLSGSILKYVAPSASVSNTAQQYVEYVLDETDDGERLKCIRQNALDGGMLGEPDIQDEKQDRETQHQNEYDQEQGRNSGNEEESEQIGYSEEELHDNDKTNSFYVTRFDVATWPTPMSDDLRVEIIKTGSEPYQN